MLPLDTSKAVVVTKSEQTISKLRVAIYRIQTERTSITVPALAYNNTRENDTIEISRSFITHAIQKVAVYKKGSAYKWRTGFISLGGLDFLVLVIISNTLYLFFFYNKLKRAESRRDVTIFLAFLTALFMLFYFLFQ